ncbi:MAG: L-ribulose-5-phosphate 4-epimerase AraD [Acidobacteriota bacterium]|nr:L-ribulose-5-phosphate 4-epimerase AraD [Acidobacteriota bacterium]
MTLEQLRTEVLEANLRLVRDGLVVETFGNASGIDRVQGIVAIKPSGVDYAKLKAADLVLTDLDGNTVAGHLKPSSDLDTHLALYRAFPDIGGVAHTHSRYATSWAQARREIPCFGTTHADYFRGTIPVTDEMEHGEIAADYELNTGHVIVRRFAHLDPMTMPAVLVAGHAPFAWGRTAAEAAHNAFLLEEVAHMAWMTVTIDPAARPISDSLRDKHFLRKHGPKAYYGQKGPK